MIPLFKAQDTIDFAGEAVPQWFSPADCFYAATTYPEPRGYNVTTACEPRTSLHVELKYIF